MHADESRSIEVITSMLVSLGRESGLSDSSIRSSVTLALKGAFSKETLTPTDRVAISAKLFRSTLDRLGLDPSDMHLEERWHMTANRVVDRLLTGASDDPIQMMIPWCDQLETMLQPLLAATFNEGGTFLVVWDTDELGADALARLERFKDTVNDREFCGVPPGLLLFIGYRHAEISSGKTRVKYAFALLFTSESSKRASNFAELPGQDG